MYKFKTISKRQEYILEERELQEARQDESDVCQEPNLSCLSSIESLDFQNASEELLCNWSFEL